MRPVFSIVLLLCSALLVPCPARGDSSIDPAGAKDSPATVPDATKKPPPVGPALADAMKTVDEVYGNDLRNAKTPEQLKALTDKILQSAQEEKDPDGRYTLLCKARDVASGSGDLQSACVAIDQMNLTFALDALKFKADAATIAVRNSHKPAQQQPLAAALPALVDAALAADRYEMAKSLAEMSLAAARSAPDSTLIPDAAAKIREVRELKAAYDGLKPAIEALAAHPTDADANLKIGIFRCLTKGDWETGLPLLVLGSNAVLKDMAAKEIASPADADQQLQLAEGWWKQSLQESGLARTRVQQHAADWYRRAAPNLTGLAKAKAESRAKEAATAAAALSPPTLSRGPAVIDLTNTREAKAIIQEVAAHYPDLFKGVNRIELAKTHDATELRRNYGAPQKLPESYSDTPVIGGGGAMMFWGLYEAWDPGDYLIVYRAQMKSKVISDNLAFLDVASGGNTIASRHPTSREWPADTWRALPFPMKLHAKTTIEFRLWPNDHTLALDRIYIFRLH